MAEQMAICFKRGIYCTGLSNRIAHSPTMTVCTLERSKNKPMAAQSRRRDSSEGLENFCRATCLHSTWERGISWILTAVRDNNSGSNGRASVTSRKQADKCCFFIKSPYGWRATRRWRVVFCQFILPWNALPDCSRDVSLSQFQI